MVIINNNDLWWRWLVTRDLKKGRGLTMKFKNKIKLMVEPIVVVHVKYCGGAG